MFKGPIEIARPLSPIHTTSDLVMSEGVARYGSDEMYLCFFVSTPEHAILTWNEALELKQQIDKWLLLRLPKPQLV